jgi:RNA polymerase sigma-70 factor (ECF subfamily)
MPDEPLGTGSEADFERLTDRHRRELLVHCYRMLGSFEDAEDILQETLLRAWRGLETLQQHGAVRAWLYRIATNACLDAIAARRSRGLPHLSLSPGDPADALPGLEAEALWIGPAPDALLDLRPSANPEVQYTARESVSLAFVAALQVLPARQRAILILRDALGFSATEVSELLGTSSTAVHSALLRARTTMKAAQVSRGSMQVDTQREADLLARFVDAWHAADAAGLVALLRDDAVFSMPPMPLWFRGRDASQAFLEHWLFSGAAPGHFRLLPTRANGCPAFGTYQRDHVGTYRPATLQVLTIENEQITELHDFLVLGDDRLFRLFDLPSALP